MSELRTRMIRNMALRSPPGTHEASVAAVVLATYYRRAPDQLTDEEVHACLAHLIQERKLSGFDAGDQTDACVIPPS